MKNSKYMKIKIALIISLVLNLSLISGFVIKKFILTQKKNGTPQKKAEYYCKNDGNRIGYYHLCRKKPEFKKLFHDHKEYYHYISNRFIKTKTELLNELKKKETKKEITEKLLKELNNLTNELNEKNFKHLLLIKNLIDPKDFTFLLDSMNQALIQHKEKDLDMDSDKFCTKNKNINKRLKK